MDVHAIGAVTLGMRRGAWAKLTRTHMKSPADSI